MSTAKVMFLDLDIPDDDPLRPAKVYVSTAAPGFRIFEQQDTIEWESDYIWLVVVNEEDGLDFKVRQTTDGKREIQAFWKERELDATRLREYLEEDPAWEVFQLRATVLLQNRVEAQIETLRGAESIKREATVRDVPWRLAKRLRSLELDMLQRAASTFDSQVRAVTFFVYPAFRSGRLLHKVSGGDMSNFTESCATPCDFGQYLCGLESLNQGWQHALETSRLLFLHLHPRTQTWPTLTSHTESETPGYRRCATVFGTNWR
jgi:hypothetical protein